MLSKIGFILTALWLGFNTLLALIILISLTIGYNATAVTLFAGNEIKNAGVLLDVANSLAFLLNATIVIFCTFCLFIQYRLRTVPDRFMFVLFCGSLVLLQAAGYGADIYLSNQNLSANFVSTVILVTGLGLLSTTYMKSNR